jgi:hypothetical protein
VRPATTSTRGLLLLALFAAVIIQLVLMT